MEIKTKFKIGDTAFIIKESKAKEIEIKSILIDETGIRYSYEEGPFLMNVYPESQCFATKDELIQYITSE